MTHTMLTYDIRSYRSEDEPAVLQLMRAALGWEDDDRFTTLFRWKHLKGPWGPSPAWVAVANGEIVGYRALMRWRFLLDGQPVDAVRAVDTATRSDYRGQGVFRKLTLHGIDAVREEGVGFVFNTPNDQSRPGYLKMGWRVLGQLPVAITAPRRLSSVRRVLSARTSASLWSLPSDAGSPASQLLADHAEHLAATSAPRAGLSTHRTAAYLRWRYGLAALGYRAITVNGDINDGVLFLRLRRRGDAVEGVVGDIIVPVDDRRAARRLLTRTRRESIADYLITLRSAPSLPGGTTPVPGQGPLLTWRDLLADEPPPLDRWRLSLGDIELF